MPITGYSVLVSSLSLTSYVIVSLLVILIAKKMKFQERNIIPWLFLSAGVIIVSLNHLVQILQELGYNVTNLLFISEQNVVILGSTLVFIGFGLIMNERILEVTYLKNKHEEIKKVMAKLKEKYLAREISEEDLKKIYPKLVEKLAELEVKMEQN